MQEIKMKKLYKKYLALGVLMVVLFFSVSIATTYAQPSVPTFLPGENADIGGTQGECVGLADKIRSGNIRLSNMKCFTKFFAQTLIAIAGSVSLIFVMFGGYRYVMETEQDKAAAKKTILYALIGFGVSLLAWIIVDLALRIATE